MEQQKETFGEWAVLELMGHRKLGGFVQEATLAGAPFIRIDVPAVEGRGAVTQFYSPSSVYCITPTTEEVARGLARAIGPAPVQRYELMPAVDSPHPYPAVSAPAPDIEDVDELAPPVVDDEEDF